MSIADEVLKCLHGTKIRPVAIAEISEMAVAVLDNYNEVDVYFARKGYSIVVPEIWKDPDGNCSLYSLPTVRDTGLGVLEGVGRFPPVRNFCDALKFAQAMLKPVNRRAEWYDMPKPVE